MVITVRYPSGKIEQRQFAIISGEVPIGTGRPIPDGAILEIMEGCLSISAGENPLERSTLIWPWDKITELDLGPVATEETILRE